MDHCVGYFCRSNPNPNPRVFLTTTFLPYGLRQILLHILNEPDVYFQMVYSLLGNSLANTSISVILQYRYTVYAICT